MRSLARNLALVTLVIGGPLIALLAAVPAASALPLYASREGRTCVGCHFDPNGGGMRNDTGFLFGRQRHGFDPDPRWPNVDVDHRLNQWIALGADVRVMYLAAHRNGTKGLELSTFFPMQGQLNVALTPHEHLTILMSRGIATDGEGYQAREIWGMVHDLPHALYAKVGRFRPPFGLRQDDHTSYLRGPFLPYDSQADEAGLEVGTAGAKYYGQFAFTNGSGTLSGTQRAQTLSAKLGMAGRRLAAGLSGYHQFREVGAVRDDRWSLYAAGTVGRFTALAEYGGGTSRAPSSIQQTRNLDAIFAELNYRATRAVNLRAKWDYSDRDRDEEGDWVYRITAGADFDPAPFAQIKTAYRYEDDAYERNFFGSSGRSQEYFVMFYFPF